MQTMRCTQTIICGTSCFLAVCLVALPAIAAHFTKELIDLTDRESLRVRKPILIAHRGGVITDMSPECSLASIRFAAQYGYDMVELDVQETADYQDFVGLRAPQGAGRRAR